MNYFALFTDVSLDPVRKLGMGAFLVVPMKTPETLPDSIEKSILSELVGLKKFEKSSSAKLEVQTVLWALDGFWKGLKVSEPVKLSLYTDSQCVAGLMKRRKTLEEKAYISSKTKCLLRNAPLYQAFYKFYDDLGFEIIKVKGHTRSASRDRAHCIFSMLDKEVRKGFRQWMSEVDLGTPCRIV